MACIIPQTQYNLLHVLGGYPGMNEGVRFVDYGGDSDPCIELEITREFYIEDQDSAESWVNLREEFWPDIE